MYQQKTPPHRLQLDSGQGNWHVSKRFETGDQSRGGRAEFSTVSEELREAYRATHFNVVEPKPFTLRIGAFSPDLLALYDAHDVSTAAFLTAWNPFSVETARHDNEAAQKSLLERLEEMQTVVFSGIGEDASGQWPGEPSILALGISRDQAMQLGNEFQQNAIVWIGADCVPGLVFLR